LDLAGESDESQTVAVASRALALRRTTAARLLAELDRVGRVRHQRVLRELCTVSSAGVESVLEWRFLQRVVRAHCLLEPTRQASLVAGTRSDNVWLDLGVVAEVDGRLGHEQAFRDMARDNRLALMGL